MNLSIATNRQPRRRRIPWSTCKIFAFFTFMVIRSYRKLYIKYVGSIPRLMFIGYLNLTAVECLVMFVAGLIKYGGQFPAQQDGRHKTIK